MALSPEFLDELRARTSLSALIGRTLKLEKAGREFKACCPFHGEKTPSFTINDEKGFYHCFGCGAHGDALRWMVDQRGLPFIDAVRELAGEAGLEMPARSADDERREAQLVDVAAVLDRAARWYGEQLLEHAGALQMLADRGVSAAAIERFGLGFAHPRRSVTACGVGNAVLLPAGLVVEDQGTGLFRDRFRNRVMIPLQDARGRTVGFAGRGMDGVEPKYLNSPDSPHFDKGRLLFNLHRAAPAARSARRLLIVEGQFDTIALDTAGIGEVVGPGGTALTIEQLERAWRVINVPVLLFDGDEAGRKAARRACEKALPHVGPGKALKVAFLPDGEDPDSLVRKPEDQGGGRAGIEAVIAASMSMDAFLYDIERSSADLSTPEGRAGFWDRLQQLGRTIADGETRGQYLSLWRGQFDALFPPPPPGLTEEEMLPDGSVSDLASLPGVTGARLRSVSAEWLKRQLRRTLTVKDAGKLAWDIGRRMTATLIDEIAGADAIEEIWAGIDGPGAKREDLDRSFAAGKKKGFDVAPMLLDMRCALFERTDMGNAERWQARYGEDYLYTTAKGWLGWDGRRYRVLNQEKDTTPAEVMASVFETVRAIQREAHFVADTGWPEDEVLSEKELDQAFREFGRDPRTFAGMDRMLGGSKRPERLSGKLASWGRASESSGRLGCIANLAKRWVTVELSDFDTDPMLLNCLNGTLRFIKDPKGGSRCELQPHSKADRLTKLAAAAYDAEAPAPIYQKLVKWAQPDPERRRYLRQWAGYNMTGDMGEQIFHIWYGPLAANGKSTVGNAWRDALGDYGDTTNVETFLDEGPKKRGDAATPDIVRLPGVRMLTAGEPPKGAKINEALINSVTGGDPMLARDNFRSFFRFTPNFKFTLWCNDLPAIPQGTAGIWRRVKVVPWEQHLKPHERDRDLPLKLKREYPGILAWMVRGLIDWMDNGFVEPESVQLASTDYKEDSDPLSSFLRLCTEPDPQARVQATTLHTLFTAWARATGETQEWTMKGFSSAMKSKGFSKKQSNGIHWLGLRATKVPADFLDEHGKVRVLDDVATPTPSPHPPASSDYDPSDDMPP